MQDEGIDTHMNNLATYLPQDRRRALAQGKHLPDRAYGAVLFADISGFTPFTEALRHAYGARRGTEELTRHLDAVYTALIMEVERYGGSVTSFAGDAITCWFDEMDESAPHRAVACAVALQEAMHAFAEIPLPKREVGQLAIKIGVATGQVRRLVVGAGANYWLDVLAGETVNRTAVAEQLASAPEILLDEETTRALGSAITLTEWRTHDETEQRFGVLGAFTAVVPPISPAPLPGLDETILIQWLNPLVYEKEKTGHSVLLTEFRPCVALFVRFTGIDYDSQSAETELNQFVSQVLHIAARYEGTLIDLTFGDKGSYCYLNFGTLSAHEDDARRATKTALELRDVAQKLPFIDRLQMGITTGVMRTGAYGAPTRRHYGALGDDVNLAARLMKAAAPNEILLSGHVYRAVESYFVGEARPPLLVKGKTEPISTFVLTDNLPALPLHEPAYTLPMVGRQAELAVIREKLALTAAGQSQIVSLVGDAGLGKSRLAAEGIRLARERGFICYGGACQSDGLNTSYLVWKQIWSDFFGLNPEQSLVAQGDQLAAGVARYAPQRLDALPLLGRLLGLPIPENEFTQLLEPKYRQTALHALLEDCLKKATPDVPHLIVVED
ncbi:MAG: adenylate/guanylate cyclase domain-containing protein, partial [Anaerolineales bacterium]|nr:adenylate/guanylate cyclase domain-containing protein [Anaerolineales bacterium]